MTDAAHPSPTPPEVPPGYRIERMDPNDESRFEQAIKVLVRGDRAAAGRFLEFARNTQLPLRHVWSMVTSDGRPEATALAAPGAGRTATVFASRPKVPARARGVGTLVRAACEGLRDSDVDLAQALLDPGDREEEAIFISGGFRRLAELDYLERPVPRFGSVVAPRLPHRVTIDPWAPTDRDRMLNLLERTYENTLDCPGLAGLRRTSDILDGHLASGKPIPGRWHVLQVDGEDAGALLLNRSSDGTTIELVYLGLVASVRGQGLGRTLLTFGLATLDDDPARTIVLAVDRANTPATALYKRQGFRFALRRIAMVRPIDEFRT